MFWWVKLEILRVWSRREIDYLLFRVSRFLWPSWTIRKQTDMWLTHGQTFSLHALLRVCCVWVHLATHGFTNMTLVSIIYIYFGRWRSKKNMFIMWCSSGKLALPHAMIKKEKHVDYARGFHHQIVITHESSIIFQSLPDLSMMWVPSNRFQWNHYFWSLSSQFLLLKWWLYHNDGYFIVGG